MQEYVPLANKILFVGGTGQISLPCVIEAKQAGHDVTVLNRGSLGDTLPAGVKQLTADFTDDDAYAAALGAAGKNDLVVIFGSFYTVAQIINSGKT